MIRTGDITPIHHLPSFWDDSSDAKLHRETQKTLPKRKPSRELLNSVGSPPSSPEVDKSFKESTLSYIQSPIGQKALEAGPPSPLPKEPLASPDSRYSAATAASSILQTPWPIPPGSIPSVSPTSSTYTAQGHLSPTPSTSSFGKRPQSPFQGSVVPVNPAPALAAPKSILKHVKRVSSTGTLRRKDTESREGTYGLRPEDVIYMTVVSEITP